MMRRRRGPGLVGGVARTAVVVGTATAVSGRVARRQQNRYAAEDQQQQAASQPRRHRAAPVAEEPGTWGARAPRRPARPGHPHPGGVRGEEEAGPRHLKRRGGGGSPSRTDRDAHGERRDPDDRSHEEDATDREHRLSQTPGSELRAHPREEERDREQDDAEDVVRGALDVRRTLAGECSAVRSSRSASALAANRYSGIAKGVGGAPLVSSGFVASHALNAGLNSGRKRAR